MGARVAFPPGWTYLDPGGLRDSSGRRDSNPQRAICLKPVPSPDPKSGAYAYSATPRNVRSGRGRGCRPAPRLLVVSCASSFQRLEGRTGFEPAYRDLPVTRLSRVRATAPSFFLSASAFNQVKTTVFVFEQRSVLELPPDGCQDGGAYVPCAICSASDHVLQRVGNLQPGQSGMVCE